MHSSSEEKSAQFNNLTNTLARNQVTEFCDTSPRLRKKNKLSGFLWLEGHRVVSRTRGHTAIALGGPESDRG